MTDLPDKQVGANPIPIPHPTNLALFGHKITLYRFNQGAHTIAGAQIGAGAELPWPLTLTTEVINTKFICTLRVINHHHCRCLWPT